MTHGFHNLISDQRGRFQEMTKGHGARFTKGLCANKPNLEKYNILLLEK